MRDSVYEIEELPALPRIGGGSVFDSIEYTEPAKRLTATVAELYRETLDRRGFAVDDAQYAAVMRLQRTYEEWIAYKARRNNALRRLVVRGLEGGGRQWRRSQIEGHHPAAQHQDRAP